LFYNCDGEEDKRNSPYICWKTHYEKDLPPRRGLWRGLKIDISQVRQRIRDGAGDCCPSGCNCLRCAKKHKIQASRCKNCQNGELANFSPSFASSEQTTGEAELQEPETQNVEPPQVFAETNPRRSEQAAFNDSTKKFGLIRSGAVTPQISPLTERPEGQPTSRYATALQELIRN
jgi:hypothetical protein